MNYRSELKAKRISIRKVASQIGVNHTVVIQVLDNKYNGSRETSKRVIDYIKFLLIDKEDLNPSIYSNPNLFIRTFTYALRSTKNFTDDEALILMDTITKLKKHIKYLNEQK